MARRLRKSAAAVPVRRERTSAEALHDWPEGYAESFAGVSDDFERPAQGGVEERREIRRAGTAQEPPSSFHEKAR